MMLVSGGGDGGGEEWGDARAWGGVGGMSVRTGSTAVSLRNWVVDSY